MAEETYTPPPTRRRFLWTAPLAALATNALIPTPTAAPVTRGTLATYATFLAFERRFALMALAGVEGARGADPYICMQNPAANFHLGERSYPVNWGEIAAAAARRAPIILDAAGCPVTSDEAERVWPDPLRA